MDLSKKDDELSSMLANTEHGLFRRRIVTVEEELANGDPEAVDKLVEVQKDAQGNPPAERPRVGALKASDAGALKTPVSK